MKGKYILLERDFGDDDDAVGLPSFSHIHLHNLTDNKIRRILLRSRRRL